jgi:hypothetical protein
MKLSCRSYNEFDATGAARARIVGKSMVWRWLRESEWRRLQRMRRDRFGSMANVSRAANEFDFGGCVRRDHFGRLATALVGK